MPFQQAGVLVRARNGDVIRYDASGLVMRLSDRVIEDIAERLGLDPRAAGRQAAAGSAPRLADQGPVAGNDEPAPDRFVRPDAPPGAGRGAAPATAFTEAGQGAAARSASAAFDAASSGSAPPQATPGAAPSTSADLRRNDASPSHAAWPGDASPDAPAPHAPPPHAPPSADASRPVPEALLPPGIDAWDLHDDGRWLWFWARLPGRQGVRRYRRARDGGAVIADAAGPLTGVLGLGGPRAALTSAGAGQFPFHVLAPADDLGAAGRSGVDRGDPVARLAPAGPLTHEAMVAETWLGWQLDGYGPLPLFMARVESDSSASARELAQGVAFDNLMTAADSLRRSAALLDKQARILAVSLDFALEDLSGSAAGYRDGMIAVMAGVERGLAALGFDRPLFVTRMDAGDPGIATAAQVEGQWELAWNHGDHRLAVSAPGYMFAQDEQFRATDAGRRHMAEMTAAAIDAARTTRPAARRAPDPLTDGWHCPLFHLAETGTDANGNPLIRMIAQAAGPLAVEAGDAACPGAAPVGFRLVDDPGGAAILRVSVDEDDPQTVLLHLDRPAGAGAGAGAGGAGRDAVRVAYAWGAPQAGGLAAVRDGWGLTASDGRLLRRWALPCLIPLRPGAMQGGGDA